MLYRSLGIRALARQRYAGAWAVPCDGTSRATRRRAEVVAYRRAERAGAMEPSEEGTSIRTRDSATGLPRYWTWAALMRRAFDLDVLRCPRCASRMQLIATINDPAVIQRILAHLGLPCTRDDPQPPWSMTAAGSEQPALPGVTV